MFKCLQNFDLILQRHYEALGEVITEEVYKLLEDKEHGGLERIKLAEPGHEGLEKLDFKSCIFHCTARDFQDHF